MKSVELKTELEILGGQKADLESQLQGARTEAARHTVRRKEISARAFLGNAEAQKELDGFTSEAVRLAHQEENLLFAIEEISLQIQDKQAVISAALENEKRAEMSMLAKGQIERIAKTAAALTAYVDLINKIKEVDQELYRLAGPRGDIFRSRHILENDLGLKLSGLFNIPFGSIDRGADLVNSALSIYVRLT